MELKKNNKFIIKNLKNNLGQYVIPDETKNGVAIDIGCNNGCFIEKNKNFFSEIHAYEANIFLVEKLKQIFNQEKIKIYHNAVSYADNLILKLLAHKYSADNGSSCIQKELNDKHWEEFICEAPSICLESILKRCNNSIDYAKIDCETSEYEFLINKKLDNIKFIGLELHSQLGEKKYTELYNFISETHIPNQKLNYRHDSHQEILFIKK